MGPRLRQVTLLLVAVGYGAAGVWFFAAPEAVESLGLQLQGASGSAEVRAMYGGLQLGLGLYFLVALRRPSWERPALRVALFTVGGLGLGRAAGVLMSQAFTPLLLGLVALEFAGAVLCGVALRSTGGSAESASQ